MRLKGYLAFFFIGFIGFGGILVFMTFLSPIKAEVLSLTEPGTKQFTPTRMQWLVMELNTSWTYTGNPTIGFKSDDILYGPNTVLIECRYSPMTLTTVDQWIAVAKERTMLIAHTHGWDEWVQIKTEIEQRP